MGGSSQQQLRDETGKLRFQPVVMRPEFKHRPWSETAEHTETRRFENAVEEILAIKRAVLLGEPGAGKTTTLWKLARDVADKAMMNSQAPLPIVVRLGKWLEADQILLDFIAAQVGMLGIYLNEIFSEGRAVLLLDGMNEIPVGQRDAKYPQIKALIERYPDWVAVVSCREQDYTVDLGFDRISITPLDPLRILEFTQHYLGDEAGEKLFWKLAGTQAREYHDDFVQKVGAEYLPIFWTATHLPDSLRWNMYDWDEKNEYGYWSGWLQTRENPSGLMLLARNPYMLSMLTQVYAEQGDLPSNRGELFKSFVETLLLREAIPDVEKASLSAGLAKVAYEMQIQRTADERKVKSGSALTVLPRDAVVGIIGEQLLYLAGSASILSLGEQVRFTHQLLQEYFAATYMDMEIKVGHLKATDIWWTSDIWWERTSWEEATILLAGLYSDDCTPILNWVMDVNPELAAQCITRSGAKTPDNTLLKLRDRWLPRLTNGEDDPNPLARAAVGRALGQVNLSDGTLLDKRPGVGLRPDGLPDIEWIEIPSGKFWYGSDKSLDPQAQDNETPRRELDLPAFQIAKYLVTYRQYQVFLDASDFENPQWWLDMSEDVVKCYEQEWQIANHPRENVSWYQAVAFCQWLSSQLGYEVRLPTEFEWEKAARGTDGRIYPYGNEFDAAKGNTSEMGIQQTSAVGIFPQGASPYGVLDMSGNVWEWCLNKYEIPDYINMDKTDKPRVLRGGCWHLSYYLARSTVRFYFTPSACDPIIGFRLVRPSYR